MTDQTRKSRFPMPFFIDNPADAAAIMRDALERDRALCAFPHELYLLSSVGAWLPANVREWVLSLPSALGPRLRPLGVA